MKKVICFILILFTLSSLSSCFNAREVPTDTVPSSTTDSATPLLPSPSAVVDREAVYNSEGNLDYQAMWPDKKILVWLYFDAFGIRQYLNSLDSPNPKSFSEFYSSIISDELIVTLNDYLVSLGKDYVIRFMKQDTIAEKIAEDYKALGSDYNAKQYFLFQDLFGYYTEYMKEMKNSGIQADIISAIPVTKGNFAIIEGDNTIQVESVAITESGGDEISNNLLLDITDFLLNEEDRKLHSYFPEEYWNMFNKYNGIYGVYNNGIASCYLFYLREDVINKYEVDISELDSIDKIDVFFDRIYEDYKTEMSGNGLMLTRNFLGSNQLLELYGISVDTDNPIVSYKYDSDNNPVVINRFKDISYIHLNEILTKWVKKGYFNKSEGAALGYELGSIAFSPYISYIQKEYTDYSDGTSEKIQYVPVELSKYILHDGRSRLIGIASWTENAESAYDYLSTLFTDPHLSNLIYYGKSYKYENGIVKQSGNYNASAFVASHLLYPNKIGEKRITDMSDALNNAYIPPDYTFEPDITGMEYNFEEISRLCKEADNIWAANPDNCLSELDNILTQLDALGYDKFLQDINMQLKQFVNSMP